MFRRSLDICSLQITISMIMAAIFKNGCHQLVAQTTSATPSCCVHGSRTTNIIYIQVKVKHMYYYKLMQY